MIFASRSIAISALTVATSIHLGSIIGFDFSEPVKLEGGQVGSTVASLGDAFEDLAQGTIESNTIEEVLNPTEPEEFLAKPELPEVTASSVPVDQVEIPYLEPVTGTVPDTAIVPEPTINATPSGVENVSIFVPVTDAEPVPTTPTPQVQPIERLAALRPIEVQTAERLEAQSPTEVQPSETQTVQSPPLPDALTAQEPEHVELTQSRRPKIRTRTFEEQHKKAEPKEETRQASRAAPAGNSQTNARAGQAKGVVVARNSQKATSDRGGTEAGNAAVSNYPGQIMRKIQRVRRPRDGSRGTATVNFRIASNGGLSALSVSNSSGSSSLDDAALHVIRRASPFPPPPQGARRSFSIQIKGR
ncbi:MAG: TonB family protein [Roseobacter sp.]